MLIRGENFHGTFHGDNIVDNATGREGPGNVRRLDFQWQIRETTNTHAGITSTEATFSKVALQQDGTAPW